MEGLTSEGRHITGNKTHFAYTSLKLSSKCHINPNKSGTYSQSWRRACIQWGL